MSAREVAQVTEIRYLRTMINGVPVVAAPAEIDMTTTDELCAVLLDAADRGRATVVVDMTRTRFCDSRGLHVLLSAHERAVAEGGELRLVLPGDGPIPRIATLMCLDQLIPSFASLAEALAQTPAATGSPRPRAPRRYPQMPSR
jgi:anti-sigma B factor antagonist